MRSRITIVVCSGLLLALLTLAYAWLPLPPPAIPERPSHPTATEALQLLQAGNERFVNDRRLFQHLDKHRIQETALEQHPFATILACSDSRVAVENLFDAGIGDLFVVRVAGNVCSDHEIGSIEYAVDHLQTPLVVVLGHTHCGAVTAVVEDANVRGKFPHLAEHIGPAFRTAQKRRPQAERSALLEETVRCNVEQAMADLLRYSGVIRTRARHGTVRIVGAVYDLQSGKVDWLGEAREAAR
ncbi:MAG: carbonic anhydrase [Planctomycetes bacterium]|nr:carbonic anhydrase [Planctomycetota bacterium]